MHAGSLRSHFQAFLMFDGRHVREMDGRHVRENNEISINQSFNQINLIKITLNLTKPYPNPTLQPVDLLTVTQAKFAHFKTRK